MKVIFITDNLNDKDFAKIRQWFKMGDGWYFAVCFKNLQDFIREIRMLDLALSEPQQEEEVLEDENKY